MIVSLYSMLFACSSSTSPSSPDISKDTTTEIAFLYTGALQAEFEPCG